MSTQPSFCRCVKTVEPHQHRFDLLLGRMLKLDITQRLDFDPTSTSEALPVGTQVDRYELLETVSEDDLGIVYRALDLKLKCEVAVKEYLPRRVAARGASNAVEPRGAAIAEAFDAAVRAFAEDARALRSLQIRSVVRVLRVWLANGTAYRAMPWIEGATLASWLRAEYAADRPATRPLLESTIEPLLQGVQAIHQRGHLHGRLSPSNVFVTSDSAVVLFGFRATAGSLDEASWSEPDAAADACRPIELVPGQLPGTSIGVAGPWSDVYGLGALMHLMVAGNLPSPAASRLIDDDYQPLGVRGAAGGDLNLLRATDWALGVLPEQRPHDVEQLKRRLHAERPGAIERARQVSATANEAPSDMPLRAVPEGAAAGRTTAKPAPQSTLSQQKAIDFVSTRPMVYEDISSAPATSTKAETAPPSSPLQPAPPVTAEPAAAPAAFDETAFNSKPLFPRAAPEARQPESPTPPRVEPPPAPLTRRARRTVTVVLMICLLLLAGLVWWLLDPWIRPTPGSASLELHAPVAAPAASASSSHERAPLGNSAPVNLRSAKAAASMPAPRPPATATATPTATPIRSSKPIPVPPPVLSARPAPVAPHHLPPPTHAHTNARCSDLLSKQSLGIAPTANKPTDPRCQ